MSTPAEVVSEQFSQSRTLADAMVEQTQEFIANFEDALFPAALVDVTFAPVEAPTALSLPAAPTFDDAEFEYDAGGTIAAAMPAALAEVAPTIDIDEFEVADPSISLPSAPSLDFGTAPEYDYGVKPTAPETSEVDVPDAPEITLPDTPTYLTLTTPTFGGVDTHDSLLSQITDDMPVLDLAAPTPFSYNVGAVYTSDVLDDIRTTLTANLAGGTGIAPAVEALIWNRERAREEAIGSADEAMVTRTHEALGFKLPTGALAAQLRQAQQKTFDRLASASRDIGIKQADLEQSNLQKAIEQAMSLEGTLIGYSFQMEQHAYTVAKTVAENAINVFNARLEKHKALLEGQRVLALAYQTVIDGEKLKIAQFQAEIDGEKAKADTNRTLVAQYEAEVNARLALVKIFESQVMASKVLVELEGAKVAKFGEEIKAYIAGINGEVAKGEVYKINMEAQKVRADAYESEIKGQLATVQVFDSQVRAFAAKAGAQGDRARALIAWYAGVVQAKTSEFDAWGKLVEAEKSRLQAVAAKSNAQLDGFKAEVAAVLGAVEQDTKHWEVQIKEYEAFQNFTFQATKMNNDVVQARGQMLLDATKAGAQILAQLASSALSNIHVSAGVSASASNGVSYSYSNDTATAPASVTAI